MHSRAAVSTDPRLFDHAPQPRETDERWTPPEVFDALGLAFDLDVAAPPGGVPWIPAAAHYSARDDGLAQTWRGLVWCNPPFSNCRPWAERFVAHGAGVILFPLNVNASWAFQLIRAVPAVLLLEHLRFVHPTHVGRHVPVMVALAGLGAGAGAVEASAARLRGVLLTPAG